MDTYKVLTEDDKHVTALWPEELLWLPGVGDVLEMFTARGIRVELEGYGQYWQADIATGPAVRIEGESSTPIIALMELLKRLEEKNG